MPSGLCPQFKATGFLGADKVVLLVGGDREGLEVFLHGRRHSLVHFHATCPEGISTRGRMDVHSQEGVI